MNCRLKACMSRATEGQLRFNNFFLCLIPNQYQSVFLSYKPRRWQKYVHGKHFQILMSLPIISEKEKPNPNHSWILRMSYILSGNNTVWGCFIKARSMDVMKYNTAKFDFMEVTGQGF